MNLDELKAAWQCQQPGDLSHLSPKEQLAQLKSGQKSMDCALLVTDILVAIVLISCTIYFLGSMREGEINWPIHTGSALILAAAAFHPWRNHRRRQREKRFGDTLRDELRKRRAQLDFQVRHSRWSSLWGYYLPIITGLCLLYWQGRINGRMTLQEFHGAVLFNLVLLGLLGYFAGGLGIRSARKQKLEVERELESLDCTVTDEELSAPQRAARFFLVFSAVAVCGYLTLSLINPRPREGSPVQTATDGSTHYAKVAPYTGVRWEANADQPTVRVDDEWLQLTAVDGIPIEELMQVARREFGDIARKRFTEDLPELLHAAGHNPGWTVTLMVDRGDGSGPAAFEVEMTEKKRRKARNFRE